MIKFIKNASQFTRENYLTIASTIIIFGALIFYVVFTSDSSYIQNGNEVILHFADNITEAHKKTIEKFNKKYAGSIKVVTVDLPFEKFSTNERKELLARSLRSKADKLDVFSVDHIWVRRFARWTESLQDEFDQSELDNFVENALKPCYVDGELHAIPLYLDVGLMFYRTDLFNTVVKDTSLKRELIESITWKKFIEIGKKFDNPYYLFPADSYEGLVCSYLEMILNQNRSFFESEEIDLTRPESVRALQTLVDLVNTYKISPPEVTGFKENHAREYFIKNNAVFVRGWPGFTIDFRKEIKSEQLLLSIESTPMPHYEGTEPAFIFGGWNLMISKYSKHKKEALIFINYLTSEESQLIMFENGKHNPVKKDIYLNEEITGKYPDLKYFDRFFEHGVHRPFLADYTRVSDIISYYLNQAITLEMEVEDALKKANDMIREGRVLVR
ncbi:MAG: ABC transporter substrate-binding protein [Melioribacteraceae bacterium]|nr:MAG: ABC transporter substrate-binding protein [Melioribacteraceae bacterium]